MLNQKKKLERVTAGTQQSNFTGKDELFQRAAKAAAASWAEEREKAKGTHF